MKALLAAAVLAIAFGGSAIAQGQSSATPPAAPTMKFKQACGADVQKLCATAQTKQDQKKCIKQNKAQLSPSCSSFLTAKHAEKIEEKQQPGATPAPTQPAPNH